MVCFRQVLTAVSQDELRSVTVRVLQTLRHDTELYHMDRYHAHRFSMSRF